MYRDKNFRVRSLEESLRDIQWANKELGPIEKVFVADGDALTMPMSMWIPILEALGQAFPRLRQVSAYATADNVLKKTPKQLAHLRAAGLSLLYIGPESGDNKTLKTIVKGNTFNEHVRAADKLREANIKSSIIMLLGAGGQARSQEHAQESAKLITAMDPDYLAALTLTIVPNTPMATWERKGGFVLPSPKTMLRELRIMVADSNLSNALFRTNHASNYLPMGGHLPTDKKRIISIIDKALAGQFPLRKESMRGL